MGGRNRMKDLEPAKPVSKCENLREAACLLLGAARSHFDSAPNGGFTDKHGKPLYVVPGAYIEALEKAVRGVPHVALDFVRMDYLAEQIFDIGMFANLTSPDRYLAGLQKCSALAAKIQDELSKRDPATAGPAKPESESPVTSELPTPERKEA